MEESQGLISSVRESTSASNKPEQLIGFDKNSLGRKNVGLRKKLLDKAAPLQKQLEKIPDSPKYYILMHQE